MLKWTILCVVKALEKVDTKSVHDPFATFASNLYMSLSQYLHQICTCPYRNICNESVHPLLQHLYRNLYIPFSQHLHRICICPFGNIHSLSQHLHQIITRPFCKICIASIHALLEHLHRMCACPLATSASNLYIPFRNYDLL